MPNGKEPNEQEIQLLKQQLSATAEQHRFDLRHPKVLELSQKLDRQIVKLMKRLPLKTN
jgi:hypothetical protein